MISEIRIKGEIDLLHPNDYVYSMVWLNGVVFQHQVYVKPLVFHRMMIDQVLVSHPTFDEPV
jgi:hypothetical protein